MNEKVKENSQMQHYSVYDKELIKAHRHDTQVKVQLLTPIFFGQKEMAPLACEVVSVDRYAVKFKFLEHDDICLWISKQYIVSTEIPGQS